MIPTLVFDIETVPDIEGLRVLYDLNASVTAEDVANIAFHQHRQHYNSDFLPLYQQRVCAISCALREGNNFKIWSIGSIDTLEAEIIQNFFNEIDRYTPQMVSWNGSGFDLPVLHYRGMIHRINASRYWDLGEDDKDFKWNNYISRYHTRHIDLMNTLAMFNSRANAPLDDLAKLCGFPGKVGMNGSQVWQAYQTGKIEEIRSYCETDVANTYLLFLRFKLMRGQLSKSAYDAEIEMVRVALMRDNAPHWKTFLNVWPSSEDR